MQLLIQDLAVLGRCQEGVVQIKHQYEAIAGNNALEALISARVQANLEWDQGRLCLRGLGQQHGTCRVNGICAGLCHAWQSLGLAQVSQLA